MWGHSTLFLGESVKHSDSPPPGLSSAAQKKHLQKAVASPRDDIRGEHDVITEHISVSPIEKLNSTYAAAQNSPY